MNWFSKSQFNWSWFFNSVKPHSNENVCTALLAFICIGMKKKESVKIETGSCIGKSTLMGLSVSLSIID